MACADIPMDILGEQNDNRGDQKGPVIQHYKPTKLVPCSKGPLHDLLQKQPAVLGVRIIQHLFHQQKAGEKVV